jgi:8-oxo-dGTP diphosphatase
MDKSAFRKRMAEADFVGPVPGERRLTSNRSAQIYRVKRGLKTSGICRRKSRRVWFSVA